MLRRSRNFVFDVTIESLVGFVGVELFTVARVVDDVLVAHGAVLCLDGFDDVAEFFFHESVRRAVVVGVICACDERFNTHGRGVIGVFEFGLAHRLIFVDFDVDSVFALEDEGIRIDVEEFVEGERVDNLTERGERNVLNRRNESVVVYADIDAEIVFDFSHRQVAVERTHDIVDCGLDIIVEVFVKNGQAVF